VSRTVGWSDLGRLPYGEALRLQHALVAERKAGAGSDRLLLVEHEPVVTLGRRGRSEHVLVGEAGLAARGIELYRIERGGDVTYHGPGQLVAYPILDLRGHRKDVRWLSRSLLDVAVRTLAALGLPSEAREGAETGVWAHDGAGPAKVASLGLRVEHWVSYHGLALNVDPDLAAFDLIVPCGLAGARVTSVARLLGRPVDPAAVRRRFLGAFADAFGVEMVPAAVGPLEVAR
jgi:lipoate-protein ligase B